MKWFEDNHEQGLGRGWLWSLLIIYSSIQLQVDRLDRTIQGSSHGLF